MLYITRNAFLATAGFMASTTSVFLGGFDMLLQALVVFMAIDLLTGFVCAVVFKCSAKTKTGRLASSVCFKGLVKKGCCFLIIVVAVYLDALLGVGTLTRDAAIIALILNELISIIENMGRMGINLPAPIANAMELLGKK
jgi:toxin secretion/phage lysis holin